MIVLTPANNKGGVGKTGISAMFAEYASLILKKKTLAIDLDPQCNFSSRYLSMEIDPSSPEGQVPPIHPDYDPTDPQNDNWDGKSSISDIFYGNPVMPYPTFIENLDIAPANGNKLLAAEHVRKNEVAQKVHDRLDEFLSLPEVQSTYDIVVIDTAPSKGPLTISAIRAATHILIPSIMEENSIQGVYGILQLWMQENFKRNNNKKIELVGILPNMFDSRTALHNQLYEDLFNHPELGKYVFPKDSKLSRRVIFAETGCTGSNPRTIFDLPDSNIAKQEALRICEFISEKVFNLEGVYA